MVSVFQCDSQAFEDVRLLLLLTKFSLLLFSNNMEKEETIGL